VLGRPTLPFDPILEAERHWKRHGWSNAAAGMAAVTSIMRAQQILLGRTDAVLKPFALSFARYEVLMLLSFSRRGSLPLGKMGERLQVNPASITNAINRLESQGLVSRKPNPVDGRGTLAEITPKGRRLAQRATQALNENTFASIGLSSEAQDQLFEILRGFRRAAGDFL
jgi:DNA-binding MarR family transcriptional regulator